MTRTLKSLEDANKCGCGAVATHSTTDSQQQEDGTWKETAPRHGCPAHPVKPDVILLDGTKIPFAEYHVN